MGKRFRLIRLAAHDFTRAIRMAEGHLGPMAIVEKVAQERSRVQLAALKALLFAMMGALWLTSAKGALTLKLPMFELSLPVVYVNWAVAFGFFLSGIGMINYFMLNEYVRLASRRLLKFDAPWALDPLYDGGNTWSSY